MKSKGVKAIYITPGRPWRMRVIESVHDKLRDECPNPERFGSLLEAQVITEQWRVDYNGLRPHSALGCQTPDEFAAQHNASRLRSAYPLPLSRGLETHGRIPAPTIGFSHDGLSDIESSMDLCGMRAGIEIRVPTLEKQKAASFRMPLSVRKNEPDY